jgi:hypothetical protein
MRRRRAPREIIGFIVCPQRGGALTGVNDA